MELKDFLSDLVHEIDAEVTASEDGGLPHEAFLNYCTDQLTEFGETEDAVACTFEATGQAVHGYSYSDYDERLDLYITHYQHASDEYTIQKREVETALKKLRRFLERTYEGKNDNVLPSDPHYDIVTTIKTCWQKILTVRLFLFTDGNSTIDEKKHDEIDGKIIQTNIWDIARFFRLKASGEDQKPTDINVSEYDLDGLRCAAASGENDEVDTFLCVMPGYFLAEIYQQFGPRLLERNVRSFQSFRTQVNKGMLKTIEEEPERFLAYNNGLTVTASNVEFQTPENKIITRIENFQIVNGGQTTNCIYRAKYQHQLELDGIWVPVKLCVIDDKKIDQIAPLVAEFANKQNAIRKSDLHANNEIYLKLEQLSRNTWAPATEGAQRETRWFFERARNQHADQVSMKKTAAQKKKFENEFPRSQKFDKGQLAKFWGAWNQEPQEVCLGAEKYHSIFMGDLENNKSKFDSNKPDESFMRLVAMAILYKSTFKQIKTKKLGMSYPGVVTNYSIALISHLSQMKLDLLDIWKHQKISEELEECIDFIAPKVTELLVEEQGYNPNEYAKGRKINRKTLWERLLEANLRLPKDFKSTEGEAPVRPSVGRGRPVTPEQEEAISKVNQYPSEELWAVASWAKETGNLEPWQRSILGTVATLPGRGKVPSGKQAVQVVKAMDEASRLGFSYEEN